MTLVVDQESISALGTHGPHPALGMAVRPRRTRRRGHDLHALATEHLIERGREPGIPIPDQESERVDPRPQIHDQIACGPRDPRPHRMGGHTQNMHPAGTDLHHEQHIQPTRKDRVDVEEIAGRQQLSGYRRITTSEDRQPAKQPNSDEIQKPKTHVR